MNKMIVEELVKNGIVGIFLLILLYFAKEVLMNVKAFIQESRADAKEEIEISRKRYAELVEKKDKLTEEHADFLKEQHIHLAAALNENQLANTELAKSLIFVAQSNQAVAAALNNQNQILVLLTEVMRPTNI